MKAIKENGESQYLNIIINLIYINKNSLLLIVVCCPKF